jgi:hypothetical protein
MFHSKGAAMARKVIRVVDFVATPAHCGWVVRYEGTSRREARRAYRAHLRPFATLRIEVDGVPVCPRCLNPLEFGFVDGGGGWHGEAEARIYDKLPQQCFGASRCWKCEPYGSFPNEDVPDDEQLAAARELRRSRSIAGQLQRVADMLNSRR